jgi:hypothetical protein
MRVYRNSEDCFQTLAEPIAVLNPKSIFVGFQWQYSILLATQLTIGCLKALSQPTTLGLDVHGKARLL